jgi:putative flippase GtrA
MKELTREVVAYGAASCCALVVDIVILWALVHFFFVWYLLAATASFASGVVVAYVLSVKLVFKHHRLKNRRMEFVGFTALGTVGMVVNAIIMFVAVKYFGLQYLIAKCVSTGFTFMCNFVTRRQLLFVLKPSLES